MAGVAGLTALVLLHGSQAHAAEGGTSFYLMGSRGPQAGILAPPGVFFANDLYAYFGSAGGALSLPLGGQIVADVRANVWIDVPTILWSTPIQILGGNLAFSASLPFGGPSIRAGLSLVSPILPALGAEAPDSIVTLADPVLGASVGWHSEHFHWSVGATLNIPVGDYRRGALANVALHRWAADFTAAVTWLDPAIGLDLSAAAGFTVNGENPATNYKTGTEFHLEWAATQFLNKDISVGFVGYFYQQISGDSGSGARLGAFKGMAVALGGTVGMNPKIGELPISLTLKFFCELEVRNRLQGTAVFLSIAVPPYIYGNTSQQAARPSLHRFW